MAFDAPVRAGRDVSPGEGRATSRWLDRDAGAGRKDRGGHVIRLPPDYAGSGMATFKVAPDKARPFVVRSGEVYAQATGTVYSVSRAGRSGGMIRVTEGNVLIWPRDERDQAVHLHAGGSLTLDPGTAPPLEPKSPTARPNRLPPPELAQISLDNVTVKSAVARFNRINSTKIVIGDEAINNMTIIAPKDCCFWQQMTISPNRAGECLRTRNHGHIVHRMGDRRTCPAHRNDRSRAQQPAPDTRDEHSRRPACGHRLPGAFPAMPVRQHMTDRTGSRVRDLLFLPAYRT